MACILFRRFFTQSLAARQHKERRKMPFSAAHVYQVVTDVKEYHRFVPWCVGSKIISQKISEMDKKEPDMRAELEVGFVTGPFRFTEKYCSDIYLVKNTSVVVKSCENAMFNHLINTWKFTPETDAACWVDFEIDFSFKSAMHASASDMFFNEVSKNFVKSFERRCALVKK